MKGLSIEEKAKRYDEAIERAKSKIKNDKDHVLYEDDVIEIFPEFKESKDERIRKAISQCVEDMRGPFEKLYGVHHKDAIDWLEKKGEEQREKILFVCGSAQTRISVGKKYRCIYSPRFLAIKPGDIIYVGDEYIANLIELCYSCFELVEEDEPHGANGANGNNDGGTAEHKEDGDLKLKSQEQDKGWSEEDRKIIIELIGIFGSAVDGEHVAFPYRLLKDYIRVLKSCLHQSTWKPRKSQIEALALATLPDVHMKYQEALKELYEDLNKLKNGEITNN